MKSWKLIALRVYLAGVVIWAFVLLGSAYNNGAFQRRHTAADLALIAVEYIAMALLWPALPFPG
jgi:hypothetical protein